MARILGGGLFGEMRGKLGSMVFARNRAGAYSRSYAKPIDPKTIAQLSARNNFGTASSNYHALDSTTKALWNNFANSVFNPKTGTMGVPSGFNAFVSLLTAVNTANLATIEYTGLTGTEVAPVFSGIPPTNALEANFVNAGGGSNSYNFGGFSNWEFANADPNFTISGNFTLNISGGGIGPTGNLSEFVDAKGNAFGFKIYMSNPVNQPGMFIQNPYLIDLGYAQGIELTAPIAMPSTITGEFSNNLVGANYSALPQTGQFVQLTLFAMSTTGMLLRIGSEFVEISEP